MPSRVGYHPAFGWVRSLLQPLRVPIVFLLSALGSYCAFQDSSRILGLNGTGSSATITGRAHVTLWNADFVGREVPLAVLPENVNRFSDDLSPDVLVVYGVPDFDALKRLRDRLGLYGFTAVMSNFTCGGKAGDFKWPIEIAILSRFPIEEATEFDPAPETLANCPESGPLTEGPVRANRVAMEIPAELRARWPEVATARGPMPRPGPGFLTARIAEKRVDIAAVKVPTAEGYASAGPVALAEMRRAIAAAAGAWLWKEKDVHEDYSFLVMGDFGAEPIKVASTGLKGWAAGATPVDSVDALLTHGEIGLGSKDRPGLAGGLQMVALTEALVVGSVGGGQASHSDRIYLWSRNLTSFGPATRAANTYGSGSYPISVQSSGASCPIDSFLRWRRAGGLSQQVLTAAASLAKTQLAAMRAARKRNRKWVVVTMLDDVLVDNSTLLYRMAQQCRRPTQKDWNEWLSKERAPPMPGAASFVTRLQALAASGNGRIVVISRRRPDKAPATEEFLKGLAPGKLGLFDVYYGVTDRNRQEIYSQIAASGARILLVVGDQLSQFPANPDLPVGGTDKSCALPTTANESQVFGLQTARFGLCYFLLPEPVE